MTSAVLTVCHAEEGFVRPAKGAPLEEVLATCGFDIVDMIPVKRQNLDKKLGVLWMSGNNVIHHRTVKRKMGKMPSKLRRWLSLPSPILMLLGSTLVMLEPTGSLDHVFTAVRNTDAGLDTLDARLSRNPLGRWVFLTREERGFRELLEIAARNAASVRASDVVAISKAESGSGWTYGRLRQHARLIGVKYSTDPPGPEELTNDGVFREWIKFHRYKFFMWRGMLFIFLGAAAQIVVILLPETKPSANRCRRIRQRPVVG